MSEPDLDLGEEDSEESRPIKSDERKVYTQPYDLSIQTLVEQWEDKLLILPDI